ncbi:nitroreductase [Actinomadura nitritigenes]|nr:hypothetical protein [Actinomadura nitritigenes]
MTGARTSGMPATQDPLASPEGVRRLVTAAIAAPSVHNTQPWRFVLSRGALELHADASRRLPVIDPRGRSMTISCGAALLNARLAMLTTGHRPDVRVLAGDAHDSTLLAEIRTGPRVTAPTAERRLYAAIHTRHSNRMPFAARRVPDDAWAALAAAARTEGAELWPVDRHAVPEMLDLVGAAERRLESDPAYGAELDRWTTDRHRLDGVPRYAFGPAASGHGVRARDFAADGTAGEPADFERQPQLAVLMTRGEGPATWLSAGQALQRVLLTATDLGVATNLLTQLLDVWDMDRRAAAPRYGTGRHIQAIVRVGYGPRAPSTPRRPVSDVLETAPPGTRG